MSSEHGDSTDEAQRLSVHLVNGPTVACGNVKAVEEGVLLFEDPGRERVSGFVPYDELRFVLPADESAGGETDERDGGETAAGRSDADVRGAEAAAEAEAQEPDTTTGTGETGDGDEETTSEASARSQATVEGETDSAGGSVRAAGTGDPTAVQGVGEAYAEDLENAGFGSLDALAAADAGDVSEAAGISPERAEQWIADAAEASGADAAEEDADGTGAEA